MVAIVSSRRAQIAAGAAVAVAAVALMVSACSGGGAHGRSATTDPAAAQAPTRWWSNDVAAAGSTIDPADPAAVAARLNVSAASYCAMLKQTLAAGRSLFDGAHAGDARLVTSTEAFVAEIERVAPVAVAEDWRTLAPTLVALVQGKPVPAGTSAGAQRNAAAAKVISQDAQQNCGLTLSS